MRYKTAQHDLSETLFFILIFSNFFNLFFYVNFYPNSLAILTNLYEIFETLLILYKYNNNNSIYTLK